MTDISNAKSERASVLISVIEWLSTLFIRRKSAERVLWLLINWDVRTIVSVRSETIIFHLKGERVYSLATVVLTHYPFVAMYCTTQSANTDIFSFLSETGLDTSDVEIRGFYYTNGDYYFGYCLRGHNIPHGRGRLTSPGKFVHEGNYKNGLCHGFGKVKLELSHHSTEMQLKSYEGGFHHGFYHGEGTATYCVPTAAGSLPENFVSRYIGSWARGWKDGHGSMLYFDGTQYKGGWKHDMPHGQGILTSANGCYYDGGWKEGKKFGFGLLVSGDGSRYEGGWIDDKKRGYGISVQPVAYEVYN